MYSYVNYKNDCYLFSLTNYKMHPLLHAIFVGKLTFEILRLKHLF